MTNNKSPADRLRQALADHEASKQAAAKSAEENSDEIEALAEVRKQLDTLPQHERSKVLNSAGLPFATAAPAPISPVSGRGSFTPPRPAATGPNWSEWALLPTVEAWEAAALLIGIEPRSVNLHKRTTFPDDAIFERFEVLTRAIRANWREFGNKVPGAPVPLAAVVRWAISKGQKVPPELLGEAFAAPNANEPERCSQTGEVRFSDFPRLFADALHEDSMSRALARIELEKELRAMVDEGRLKVLNPLTRAEHPFPQGDALQEAIVPADTVSRLLSERGIRPECASDDAPGGDEQPLDESSATTQADLAVVKIGNEGAHRRQERMILEALRSLGYDPKSLPKHKPNAPGAKAEVRGILRQFTDAQFKKAWERLRQFGEVSDQGGLFG